MSYIHLYIFTQSLYVDWDIVTAAKKIWMLASVTIMCSAPCTGEAVRGSWGCIWAPWPHRSLTLAPWSPHHIGTDWGHWPRLTTRPARGLGPASRTPGHGHVCRLIYVIFITSHCSMKIIKQMAKIHCNIAQIHRSHSLVLSVEWKCNTRQRL